MMLTKKVEWNQMDDNVRILESSNPFTDFSDMQSSSHLIVRSTDALFLFALTEAGTSSAKLTHKSGFIEEIIFMYSIGFT